MVSHQSVLSHLRVFCREKYPTLYFKTVKVPHVDCKKFGDTLVVGLGDYSEGPLLFMDSNSRKNCRAIDIKRKAVLLVPESHKAS